MSAEHERLTTDGPAWRRWGPYLAERAWGTVREDYSPGGSAWDSFPHDHARSRAYRWNEDGLLFYEYFHGDSGRCSPLRPRAPLSPRRPARSPRPSAALAGA